MWKFDEFLDVAPHRCRPTSRIMDRLLQHAQTLHGSDQLADDFSIVEVEF